MAKAAATTGKEKKAKKQKRMTKAQVIAELYERTKIEKKSIGSVFDELSKIIKRELAEKSAEEFVIPGLLKLKAVTKEAQPARDGVNPFTKEPMQIPAKPRTRKVRATPLKALKDLINGK